MKPERDDIVRDILQRCIDACPGFGAELAAELEQSVRNDWGGDSYYVRKSSEIRKQAVKDGLKAGKPIAALQSELGISRSAIYRLLSKK